jgi:hypothetical protein
VREVAVSFDLSRATADDLLRAAVEDLIGFEEVPSFARDWVIQALREMPPSLPRKFVNPLLAAEIRNAMGAWILNAIELRAKRQPPGRPRETIDQKQLKWAVVGACAALIDAGAESPAAAETVAKIAGKLKICTATGGTISKGTVTNWWRNLAACAGPRFFAAMISGDERPVSIEQIIEASRELLRSCRDGESRD